MTVITDEILKRWHDARDEAFEESAMLCEQIIAAMKQHRNPDGLISGPDFYLCEIETLKEAARLIRAKRRSYGDSDGTP